MLAALNYLPHQEGIATKYVAEIRDPTDPRSKLCPNRMHSAGPSILSMARGIVRSWKALIMVSSWDFALAMFLL